MTEQFPETAARLQAAAPLILRRWDARVRREIPASEHQSALVLQNNLGQLLGEVTQALSPTGGNPALIEGLTLSQDHGKHRATLVEYSIDEMFLEYRLLRQTILDVLDAGPRLLPVEREVITNALERAMQDAVGQFSHVHQRRERERADALALALQREQRITRVLQRPLLEAVGAERVPGFGLATHYAPAGKEAEVGGDFLDLFPLPDGRTALVIGDASGKGVEAAAHNTLVKEVLRVFLRQEPDDLGAVLGRVNGVVCDLLQAVDPPDLETFVVVAVLVVNPRSPEACYVSAGAEPLLVLKAGGRAFPVLHPGLPLGVDPAAAYAARAVRLAPGDGALLVTDGITEARYRGELLGYRGMAELAQFCFAGLPLSAMGPAIVAGARGFARGRLADDACLLLARRDGGTAGPGANGKKVSLAGKK